MMSTIELCCYLLLILEDHWMLKKLGSIEHSLVLIEPLLPSKEAHSKHTHKTFEMTFGNINLEQVQKPFWGDRWDKVQIHFLTFLRTVGIINGKLTITM